MKLPETYMSEHGLTVEGAGPELLAELLVEHEEVLRRTDPQSLESLRPGLSREEIVAGFEGIGLPVPEELIAWWTWRNGHIPMVRHGLSPARNSLEQAVELWWEDEGFAFELSHGPTWVRVEGENLRHSTTVLCDDSVQGLLIRYCDPELNFDFGPLPDRCVVSLSTLMTWRLVAIREGWCRYDSSIGVWQMVEYASVPEEWRRTRLI